MGTKLWLHIYHIFLLAKGDQASADHVSALKDDHVSVLKNFLYSAN